MRLCSFESCSNIHKAKGFCDNHYRKLQRWGDPFARRNHIRHGERYTTEYNTWLHMKQRCTNTKSRDYKNYGARGIRVCEEWLSDYRIFLEDMGKKPSPRHSIERQDNDGDYTPENCHWAISREQAVNQRMRKDNKSGYRGVYRRGKKWAAQVRNHNKSLNIGVFTTPEEAAYIRDQVAIQLHGRIAKLNFDYA